MPKHLRLSVTQTRIAYLGCLYQTLFAFPLEDVIKTNRQIQRNAYNILYVLQAEIGQML